MCHTIRMGWEAEEAEFARQACGRRQAWFAARAAGRHGRPLEEGFWGYGPGRFGYGFGGRERLFDSGEIKLVILKLLYEQPSYGYQLMKSMEERLAGGYTPSAGVVYPTLTLLEEEGLATSSSSEGNKKVYSLTDEGQRFVEANKERIGEVFERIAAVGERFERRRSPELLQAFANLRHAVMGRMWRRNITPEQVRKIAEAVNAAAKAIEEGGE